MHSPASSCGRNVTEAVIWRKMAAISDWISDSDFSVATAEVAAVAAGDGCWLATPGEGAAFSWSSEDGAAALEGLEDLVLDDLGVARIWTCVTSTRHDTSQRLVGLECSWVGSFNEEAREGRWRAYVKLPPFQVLARVLVRDDDDQLGDLSILHPPVQLRHDLLDVRLDLVVRRHQHIQSVLFHDGEVLGRVHAALVQDGVYRVLELRIVASGQHVESRDWVPESCITGKGESRQGEIHTNSATSFALPLSESLCTLEVSFFSLLGFSDVAMVNV